MIHRKFACHNGNNLLIEGFFESLWSLGTRRQREILYELQEKTENYRLTKDEVERKRIIEHHERNFW